jgi:hypothetical protein
MSTMEDIGSRRHAQNLKWFEESMLGCFTALSDLNDDVAEHDPAFTVRREIRGKFLETSKWSELKIDAGDIRINVFPISSLPTTPGGRYDRIQQWVQSGWMPQDVAMQLLGLPDLEAYEDLATADLRAAQWQVNRILDGEQNVRPVPQQNLLVAADFARKSYVSELQDGAPPEVLYELDAFIRYCKRLYEQQQSEQQGMAAIDANAAPGTPPPNAMTPPAEQQALAA